MAIQTNHGDVFENQFDMINSHIFDPSTADPRPPSIDDQFDKWINDPNLDQDTDPSGNPIMPLQAPEKPTGAFNSELGMQVADTSI